MQSVCRACAEQGDARNRIENRCFRILILKLVNPLESLEDRIAMQFVQFNLSYMNRFLCEPLVFSSSSLKQHNMASPHSSHIPGGGVYLGL